MKCDKLNQTETVVFQKAVIIRTNGRIMAGILRTNEHSHAHRPISGASGLPLTSPRSIRR